MNEKRIIYFGLKFCFYSLFYIVNPCGIFYAYTRELKSSDRLRVRVKHITAHYMENNVEQISFVLPEAARRTSSSPITGGVNNIEWPESVNEITFEITVEKVKGTGIDEYFTISLHYHQLLQNAALLKIKDHSIFLL